ncbi:unnamed protein product [Amoebophrya sp. A25]|nr:unnamed protein product [Amoebophrya sp. A25]|eukprot:GSA25T00015703001.1
MGGSKKKVGKERLDKYYQLAKDQGYRARSAFKLVQLAKKVDFLSEARVCIDLCGAPGGWSQVAAKNMPRGSKVICVDLCPIKPIPGVVGITCDITTPKCRQLLRKELDGRPVDVVLNDGAPNVGSSWVLDAYVQNELVLHALKLAGDMLRPGGTFVTKVFRSQDYTSLLWVFEQLFQKVEATKPQASRNVSAEIFVMCHGFKSIKPDPKFFDPKWVFMEAVDEEKKQNTSGASLVDLLKYQTKKHRGGYEKGDDMRTTPVMEFLKSTLPAQILTTHHRLTFEKASDTFEMNEELREYCGDLKVLGKSELSKLLKWRILARRKYEKERKELVGDRDGTEKGAEKGEEDEKMDPAEKAAKAADAKDDAADAELSSMISDMKRDERREAKKLREQKKKFEWRKKMSMGLRYTGITHDADLFSSSADKTAFSKLEDFDEGAGGRVDSDEEMEAQEAAQDDDDSEEEEDGDEVEDPELAELNRLADLEAEQIMSQREMRSKLSQAQQGRELKKKKETRRQVKYKEWGQEMDRFNHELDEEAAKTHQADAHLESDSGSDDDSDDDDADMAEGEDEMDKKKRQIKKASINNSSMTGKIKANLGGDEGDAALLSGDDSDSENVNKDTNMKENQDSEDDEEAATTRAGTDEDESDDEAEEEGEKVDAKSAVRAERWFSQDLFSSLQSRLQSGASTSSKSGAATSLSSSSSKAMKKAPATSSLELQEGTNSSDEDSENEQSIDVLDDKDLPHIPLCDKKKRQMRRRKEKEREARKEAAAKGKAVAKDLVGGDDEEDAQKARILDDGTPFDIVERGFDEEMDQILLPGQESQRGKDNRPDHLKPPGDKQELAAVQALGSMMIRKKSRMALLDSAYNRYAWDDDGLDLPEWFTEEESKYNKPELPVTKELMDQYRAKLKEINQRPIRKVAEANARNKKRLQQRMDKVRKQAKMLAADSEMSAGAKARNMEKMIRKAQKEGSKKQAYMAIRKAGGNRNVTKGKATAGAKAKVVDKRLKADKRGLKKAEKNAKKGKHKGNRARKSGGGKSGGVKKKGGKKGGGGGKKGGKK